MPPNLVRMSFSRALHMVLKAVLIPRVFAQASSLSPWMVRTGFRLRTVPTAAAAGVMRPPFFRYSRGVDRDVDRGVQAFFFQDFFDLASAIAGFGKDPGVVNRLGLSDGNPVIVLSRAPCLQILRPGPVRAAVWQVLLKPLDMGDEDDFIVGL